MLQVVCESLPQLIGITVNEILLRGFAVYLPGATVTAPLTIDSQLQPTGQMLHRVYDQSRVKTECQGEGGNSLCPYRNFSFVVGFQRRN